MHRSKVRVPSGRGTAGTGAWKQLRGVSFLAFFSISPVFYHGHVSSQTTTKCVRGRRVRSRRRAVPSARCWGANPDSRPARATDGPESTFPGEQRTLWAPRAASGDGSECPDEKPSPREAWLPSPSRSAGQRSPGQPGASEESLGPFQDHGQRPHPTPAVGQAPPSCWQGPAGGHHVPQEASLRVHGLLISRGPSGAPGTACPARGPAERPARRKHTPIGKGLAVALLTSTRPLTLCNGFCASRSVSPPPRKRGVRGETGLFLLEPFQYFPHLNGIANSRVLRSLVRSPQRPRGGGGGDPACGRRAALCR